MKHIILEDPEIRLNILRHIFGVDKYKLIRENVQKFIYSLKEDIKIFSCLLKSDFFSFIAWGLRLTGNNNLPYLFNAIPNISKEHNQFKTMEQIKHSFELTNEEVKFIQNNFHAYKYEDKDIFEKCGKNTQKQLSSSKTKTRKQKK